MREPVKRAEIESRVVVTWAGPGQPIMLTVYGMDGKVVAVALEPKRALTLAQELLTRGVSAIQADSWDAMYEQGARRDYRQRFFWRPGTRAPQRAPDLGAAAR